MAATWCSWVVRSQPPCGNSQPIRSGGRRLNSHCAPRPDSRRPHVWSRSDRVDSGPADFVAEVTSRCAAVGIVLAEPLGPVHLPEGRARLLLRHLYQQAAAVAAVLAAVQVERSQARAPVVTVRVDPQDID